MQKTIKDSTELKFVSVFFYKGEKKQWGSKRSLFETVKQTYATSICCYNLKLRTIMNLLNIVQMFPPRQKNVATLDVKSLCIYLESEVVTS